MSGDLKRFRVWDAAGSSHEVRAHRMTREEDWVTFWSGADEAALFFRPSVVLALPPKPAVQGR